MQRKNIIIGDGMKHVKKHSESVHVNVVKDPWACRRTNESHA